MTKSLFPILAFLRRDYVLAGASPLAYAWQVAGIVLVAPMLHYVGRLVPSSQHLRPFGGDYFSFAVVGLGVFGFLAAATTSVATAVRQEQTVGTIEALLASPVSMLGLILGAALWPVIVAATNLGLYLAIAHWAFGTGLANANFLSGGIVLILSLSIAVALSVLGAAIVLVFRHPDPFSAVVTGLSAVLAGVFYPPTVLPPALVRLAEFLPWTHALRGVRLAVLQGYGVGALQGELFVLAGFGVVLVPLSIAVLRRAVEYAKSAGTLHTY